MSKPAPRPEAGLEQVGAARYRIRGELSFAVAARLYGEGRRAFSGDTAPGLEVDCSGVTSADSAGLAVLLEWLAWAATAGRTLKFVGVPENLRAIARISEVESLLEPG